MARNKQNNAATKAAEKAGAAEAAKAAEEAAAAEAAKAAEEAAAAEAAKAAKEAAAAEAARKAGKAPKGGWCYEVIEPFRMGRSIIKPPCWIQLTDEQFDLYRAAGVVGDEQAYPPGQEPAE